MHKKVHNSAKMHLIDQIYHKMTHFKWQDNFHITKENKWRFSHLLLWLVKLSQLAKKWFYGMHFQLMEYLSQFHGLWWKWLCYFHYYFCMLVKTIPKSIACENCREHFCTAEKASRTWREGAYIMHLNVTFPPNQIN